VVGAATSNPTRSRRISCHRGVLECAVIASRTPARRSRQALSLEKTRTVTARTHQVSCGPTDQLHVSERNRVHDSGPAEDQFGQDPRLELRYEKKARRPEGRQATLLA